MARRHIAVIIFIFLALLIYSNTFTASFHFDDKLSILSNPHIKHISHIGILWEGGRARFLTYLTIAMNYSIGKLDVTGYHIVNILIHIITGILVYSLALLTFQTPRIKGLVIARDGKSIAFFAGLIFIAHPIQTQAVTYIIQRATSLAALFYIAAIALYVQSRLHRSVFYYILFLIAALCALLCKEISITLPFLILLYEGTFFTAEGRKTYCMSLIAIFLIAFIFMPYHIYVSYLIDFINMKNAKEPYSGASSYCYLLTQFRVILTYIRLLFIPINQAVDYDYRISRTIFELPTIFSILALLGIGITTLRMYRRERLIAFAILWFFFTLAPALRYVPAMDNFIYEHRVYLPMFGFSLFLSTIIFSRLGREKAAIILITLVAILSVLTYMRNFVWKDDFTLWDDAVRKMPKNSRAHCNRGFEFFNMGNYEAALADYNAALKNDPRYVVAYCNRGALYAMKGDMRGALREFDKALIISPHYADAHYNRAKAYARMNDIQRAIAEYEETIVLNYFFIDAYINLGNIYVRRGELHKAMSMYSRAITVDRGYPNIYVNRALVYFMRRDFDKAWKDVQKARQLGGSVDASFLKDLRRASGRQN